MSRHLETGLTPYLDARQMRVDEVIKTINEQHDALVSRKIAGVLRNFWVQTLTAPEDGSVKIELKKIDQNRQNSILDVNPQQVITLNRSDELWRKTVVDSGTLKAYLIVTKTDANGNTDKNTIRVSPFDYKTENGTNSSILKPDAIETDRNLSKGKIFRSID